MKKSVLIAYKLGFALLVLVAVFAQISSLRQVGVFNPANFFSFFTIESNIFGTIMLMVSAYLLFAERKWSKLDFLRGASTLYMVITGIVYSLLLANADVQTPTPWVNAVLHYIFPIVMLADWLIDKPKKLPTTKQSLLWLAFPVVYVIYSLVRGSITNWYPYPFLNAHQHGYIQVAITSLFIAVMSGVMALLIGKAPKFLRS